MRSETRGFLALTAILGSVMMLFWSYSVLAGLFMGLVIVSTVQQTTKKEWQRLGEQIDSTVFTIVVLISGTMLLFSQTA